MAKTKSYDRIIRENIEPLVIPLATRLLHLSIPAVEEIPDDLHQTIERKPDFLKKVVHPKAVDDYILHFEFQTADDSEMAERMLEYYALLYRKYRLSVKQYVFYIGAGTSQMQSHILHDALSFRYDLINTSEVNHRLFLNSSVPEEVLLTILGNYGEDNAGTVIQEIIVKLGQLVPRSLRLKRYVKQLEVLSKLRNLQELTIKISEKMALVYDLETDVRFKQGVEQGIERGLERGLEQGIEKGVEQGINQGVDLTIERMIRRGKLSHADIAENAGVSIDHVEAIAQRIATL